MGSFGGESLARLRTMIDGYQISQVIAVMADLGIADVLATGSQSAATIAAQTGADRNALTRLLHALASVDLVRHEGEDVFALTEMGSLLRGDDPSAVRAIAIHAGQPAMWAAWSHLLHSVQTGEPAFPHVHGTGVWEYRARHDDVGRVFAAAMAASPDVAEAIVRAYDFAATKIIVDVGGGTGGLLASILARRPDANGILLEQPEVAVEARVALDAAGGGERCAVVAGDFFATVPAGGDLYILKGVLHDWSDERAAQILAHCRRAMDQHATLLVIEGMIDDGANAFTRFMDLHMLVIHGGRERTGDDFARLFGHAGFLLRRMLPTETGLTILEAVPRS